MKFASARMRRNRGSALITVVFLIGVMALITASLLLYTRNERRANERNTLILRARNMSENISAYAAEQITTKLYRLRSFTPMKFTTGVNQTHLPPAHVLDSAYSSSTNGMEVRAGLTGSTGLQLINPATNPNNANAGLQVNTSTIPIIAKATVTHPSIGSFVAYTQYDLETDMVPLFQFAVFYNMDMEFGPGADMIIAGPIHTNGNLIARSQTGFSNTIQFLDRVSAAGGFFANTAHKGPTYNERGTADNGPGGDGPLRLQNTAGTVTTIQSGSLWRDHKYGASAVSPSTLNSFKTFASSSYGVNFRTSVHGVTPLVLPGVSNYQETDDADTPEDDRDNGRQIIAPAATTDTAQLKETKFARRAGLYIIVNPDDETRNGVLPDATVVPMRARSYRAWLNTVNADLSHSIAEVILPGQPSYGPMNAYVNNLPNFYRTNSSVRHNQVLRIPQGGGVDLAGTGYDLGSGVPTIGGTFADAYFWDMRRANNNRGGAPYARSASDPYTPRPITKIDFDMTRFKMAAERTLLDASTSTIFYPAYPSDSGTWGDFIFNPDGGTGTYGLGLGESFDQFPARAPIAGIQKSSTGTLAPKSIVVNSYARNGNSVRFDYPARFVIEESSNNGSSWGNASSSTSDEISRTYTPSSTATHVRIRLYLAGTTPPIASKLCDEQIIPVIPNTGTVSVLSSSYQVVPSTPTPASNVAAYGYNDAATEMRIYVNGVDDTPNWRFSTSSPSNVSGSFGTGPNSNRFQPSALTAPRGTITLVATHILTGAITSQLLTLDKQSNVSGLIDPPQGVQSNHARWLEVNRSEPGDPFRIYYAPADPDNPLIQSNPSTFAVSAGNLVNTSGPCPWFDGITVYIHSADAEVRAQTSGSPNRIDSAVRLLNGRGSLISLSGTTYPGRTGLAFATNDAAYIIGHYNADGSINNNSNSTANPGGYSARYREATSEMLTSLMADAITIVSHPSYVREGSSPNYVYRQTAGWTDSLSDHRRGTSNYDSSWRTTNPSGSNTQDGEDDSFWPALMPNLGNAVAGPAGSGSAPTSKLAPINTEVSAALLTGIVPTNHNPTGLTDGAPSSTANNQTSGGVHNFPRLLEQWGSAGLYIRGSMVGMFESRVAMEPWSLRVYSAPGRYWGLHESLRSVNHDLPLEPVLLNSRRVRFRELTAPQYNAQKATIEALP